MKHYREDRGWSQKELADRVTVSRQSINAIEIGKYDPRLSLAFKIADLFEVSVDEMFGLDRKGDRSHQQR